jgi:type III restriction enzyme
VNIDTDVLIQQVIEKINQLNLKQPSIEINKIGISFKSNTQIDTNFIGTDTRDFDKNYKIPNIVEIISTETKLTKRTIIKILNGVKNLNLIFQDPQQYISLIILVIKSVLTKFLLNGIVYTQIDDAFKIELFEDLDDYEDNIIPADNSIYEGIICDSNIEKEFTNQLKKMNDVKFFLKLPYWFTITTPIGNYNPDWGIVLEKRDTRGKLHNVLYFVSETKGTKEELDLRLREQGKIECAKKHFSTISSDVLYIVTNNAKELRTLA